MRKNITMLCKTYGGRAYAECIAVFGTVQEASKALGISDSTINYWVNSSTTPSCEVLAKMWELGFDIEYIFTGYPGYNQGPYYPYTTPDY